MSTSILVIAFLLIWGVCGLIWSAVSEHEWNDQIDPIIAGPLYWIIAALYSLNIIDLSCHYGEDEELDITPKD